MSAGHSVSRLQLRDARAKASPAPAAASAAAVNPAEASATHASTVRHGNIARFKAASSKSSREISSAINIPARASSNAKGQPPSQMAPSTTGASTIADKVRTARSPTARDGGPASLSSRASVMQSRFIRSSRQERERRNGVGGADIRQPLPSGNRARNPATTHRRKRVPNRRSARSENWTGAFHHLSG